MTMNKLAIILTCLIAFCGCKVYGPVVYAPKALKVVTSLYSASYAPSAVIPVDVKGKLK